MKNIKKIKSYLIPPIIVIVILFIVFKLKGIYPFGNKTIATGDLGQSYMTFYHFLYDVLQGKKSLFYDYCLGMGSNTYGGFVIDGFYNPINWIIILGKRNNIPYNLSYVLILKMIFISITSYILFKKVNKNNYYNIIFSVLYTFSGYTLFYYSNLMWLDVVGLFPLLILSLKYMFDTNKVRYFSIVLALILICNYNLAYMVLIFIIVIIPVYIHFTMDKYSRKKAVFNLIIGIIFSIGLSAFAFIPALVQTLTSYRMSGAITNDIYNVNIFHKLEMIMFSSLPVTIYLIGLLDKKSDKKIYKISNISLLLCFVIPVLFERVNLWWHTGSYQSFPFRFGFIPLLILFMTSLYYINSKCEKQNIKNKKNIVNYIVVICSIFILSIILIYTSNLINYNNPVFDYTNQFKFILMLLCFLIGIFIELKINNISHKKNKYILLTIVSFIFIIGYSYAFIGINYETNDIEHGDKPVFYAEKLSHEIESDLYRVKDLTNSQFENNPLVSNLPSMLSFLHLISKEQVENTKQLGYSIDNTKLMDGGGTLFTDQLYGIKYTISYEKLPEEIYDFVKKYDNKYIYKYKDNITYGIINKSNNMYIPEKYQIFEANNYLYKKLFNKNDNIIEKKVYKVNKNDKELEFKIKIENAKEFYLYIERDNSDEFPKIEYISINGIKKKIPNINNQASTDYPTRYSNGILDLGYYENEELTIKMKLSKLSEDNYEIEFGQLDIKKLNEIVKTRHELNIEIIKNSIKISGLSNEKNNMILPITYNNGFKSNKKIKRAYNNFIEIPINKGENNIIITFIPKLFNKSVIITILTIILMVIFSYIEKIINIRNNKILITTSWLLGVIIYIIVIFKFYIISILKTLFKF